MPPEKLIRQFPTPLVSHGFFIERIASKQESFKTGDSELAQLEIPIGTLHRDQTTYPGVRLVHVQASTGDDDWVTRFWANDRAAADQNFYNFVLNYSSDSGSHPIFIRRYILPRDSYVKGNRGAPLTSLIGLHLSAAGTGYTSAPAVVFTGTGSGAAAVATVNEAGAVIGLTLTNGGTGYTATPAVSFVGGGGAGANAVAIIQSQFAVLVKEEETEAPPELVSRYVVVNRIYESLPGPELVTPGIDNESGALTKIYKKRVYVGTATLVEGDVKEGSGASAYYVVDSEYQPESANVGFLVTIAMKIPATRIENKSIGFQFPAIFNWLGSIDLSVKTTIRPPWAGVDFTLSAHRTATKPANETISYTVGKSLVALPDTWEVITPGKASKIFPIGDNTIHNAIVAYEIIDTGTYLVENLPASTPSSYNPAVALIIQCSQRRWKGPFWERRILTVTETPP